MVESNQQPVEICDNIPKYLGRRNFPWFPSCTWEPPVAPKLSLGQIFIPKLSLGTSKTSINSTPKIVLDIMLILAFSYVNVKINMEVFGYDSSQGFQRRLGS